MFEGGIYMNLWYRTISSPCYSYIYRQTNQHNMPKQIIKCVCECVCVCVIVFCVSIKPLGNAKGIYYDGMQSSEICSLSTLDP